METTTRALNHQRPLKAPPAHNPRAAVEVEVAALAHTAEEEAAEVLARTEAVEVVAALARTAVAAVEVAALAHTAAVVEAAVLATAAVAEEARATAVEVAVGLAPVAARVPASDTFLAARSALFAWTR